MAREPRLTEIAHREISAIVRPGDVAIDATAGNGHDTMFLADRVGPGGRVYAFDIQAQALERTHRSLEATGLADRVALLQRGHEQLCGGLPAETRGNVAAAMFNLGYLPGGDRQRITRSTTTLAALEQVQQCLRPGGILTLIAYPGHPGGRRETEAVRGWLRRHPAFASQVQEICPSGNNAPVLMIVHAWRCGERQRPREH